MTRSTGVPHLSRPLVVWRFVDGKPGHENQSLGLMRALADETAVESQDIPVPSGLRSWLDLMLGLCPAGAGLPAPDLLIGVGHATHAGMLACRRARGGRVVVLMRPSLPLRWFDLSVIPEHDGVPPSERVLVTRGVLNPVRPAATKDAALGMILVGGPSRHYGWNEQSLCDQVAAVVARDPRRWIVATSRRTPASTLAALRAVSADNLTLVPSAETAVGWLTGQLASASVVWVTEDSVSMLYEALTSGAACGVLPVPPLGSSAVRAGLQGLVDDGIVRTFEAWRAGAELAPPRQPFNEAARCARWILARWFAN